MTALRKILAFTFKNDDLQSLYDDVQEFDRIRAEEGEDAADILDGENDTNIAFYDPKPLKNVELVRLSKKAMTLEEMLCHSGYRNLGLTVGPFGDKHPDDPDGLCFAFQKSYYQKRKADLQGKYGKNELFFKVKEALDVGHFGDEERQVIFSPQSIVESKAMANFLLRADSEIEYQENHEDDEYRIEAWIDGKEIGHITFVTELVEGDEDEPGFPFEPYAGEKFVKKLYGHEEVVNLKHLDVHKDYRGKGIAKELMTRAMESIKKKYSGIPVYINASPLGGSISLDELVNFYKKFGFKVLKKYPEHRNALLWREK